MMHRGLIGGLAVAVAAALLQATPVQADPVVGTQANIDIDTPTANTNNINTATIFTLGSLQTTPSRTGDYTLVPSGQALGGATLTLATRSTFSFGNAVFGTFTATSLTTLLNVPGAVGYDIKGVFAPGSGFPASKGSTEADFLLTFIQSGGTNTAISASGTLVSVPEPGSLLLGLTVAVGVGLASGLRRRFRAAA
jgi:hypothetical protein